MENEIVNENNQSQETQATLEDCFLAVEVIRKALEFRPYIREAIVGEKFLGLSGQERLNETLTPRICFFFVDEQRKVPGLFFRYVGENAPILETFFYPIDAVLTFLYEARNIMKSFTNKTEEEREELVFTHALDMTLLLFDNFYRRAEITMDYIVTEVMAQWHRNKQDEWIRQQSEQGNKLSTKKDPFLDNVLNGYRKEIGNFWRFQGQTRENWRKIEFAEEYEVLYKHWNLLVKVSNDESSNWRNYAKAGKFADTPDDLINKLLDVDRLNEETTSNKISEIAIEHAARRAGLIKKSGVSEWAQNKRKEGIKVSDYSSQQLFTYLKEGRELKKNLEENEKFLAQIETESNFEQINESALKKKTELLEQRINFVQNKIEDQLEQKAKSAQGENS